MDPIDPPVLARPRFQFTLRDAYLVLGLVCAAFGLAEFLRGGVSVYHRPSREAVAVGALVVTCLGACVGLWRARVRRWMGATNAGSILWYVLVLWAAGTLSLFGSPAVACVLFIPTIVAAWTGQWWGERVTPSSGLWCAVCACFLLLVFFGAVLPNMTRSRTVSNYSAAIAACKTYAEAQEIYRSYDWDSDGVLEYAASITGDNSLFEKHAGSGDLVLVDAAFANSEGDPGTAQPKAGYVFKVLAGQGPHAPSGAFSYLDANGNMTKGYALMATPAKYNGTGRNSFLINNRGTVYYKDLGPETTKVYLATDAYDPDDGWLVAE
ncbi:MAG: DUF2950 domain-containing protein [Planctomycetes bacterium]|nr:DUF2950 domain-containing protein [Planctomycetota bacterium]